MAKTHIIYGFHAVCAVLKNHPENILHLYYQEKMDNIRLRALLEDAQGKIFSEKVSLATLNKITQTTHHQGIAATIRQTKNWQLQDLLEWLTALQKPCLLLLLEGIQDPHNLGACLRSAEALGVDWVIIPKMHIAPLNATVSKVACGADQSLKMVIVPNLVRAIKQIQEYNIWVVGTSGGATVSLNQASLTRSCALVMGTEEKGLKRLTLEACDEVVSIPLSGTVESLNVSVATGICLYECKRQREKQK